MQGHWHTFGCFQQGSLGKKNNQDRTKTTIKSERAWSELKHAKVLVWSAERYRLILNCIKRKQKTQNKTVEINLKYKHTFFQWKGKQKLMWLY